MSNQPVAPANCRVEIVADANAAAIEGVRAMLRLYNERANPTFWRKAADPAHAPQPLHLIAYDNNNSVAGGLLGETALAWLKINILAVREDLRRRGLGRLLVQQAEIEALRRGCCYAYLDTMEFQAPEFYRRLGYEKAGVLPDWDSHGHSKFFFIKRLSS
jgi:GNAT superfamily N-acetyltransferase